MQMCDCSAPRFDEHLPVAYQDQFLHWLAFARDFGSWLKRSPTADFNKLRQLFPAQAGKSALAEQMQLLHGSHIASHNSYRRNGGCYNVERRGGALPPGPLVRQNYSLVFGTFAGFWLALLFPLRPFALSLQRLWSLLGWPLAIQQPVSVKSRGQPSRAPGCRIALPR